MGKNSQSRFNEMTVFTLGNTVLLGGVRARNSVRDARALEVLMQPMILTAPVGLDGFNFSIQKELNMGLESIENLLDIRLMFKEINPAETRVVIDKTNTIIMTTSRSLGRAPYIGINKLKRFGDYTI